MSTKNTLLHLYNAMLGSLDNLRMAFEFFPPVGFFTSSPSFLQRLELRKMQFNVYIELEEEDDSMDDDVFETYSGYECLYETAKEIHTTLTSFLDVIRTHLSQNKSDVLTAYFSQLNPLVMEFQTFFEEKALVFFNGNAWDKTDMFATRTSEDDIYRMISSLYLLTMWLNKSKELAEAEA